MSKNPTEEPSRLITIKLEIDPSDLDRLPVAIEAGHAMAAHELRSQPFESGLVGWLASFADDVRFAAMTARAEPELEAESKSKSKGNRQMPIPKVKHVFGSNGICQVKHDGHTPCSVVRTRKPRAGSKNAAVADTAAQSETLEADPRQTTIPGADDGQA